jgi:uncharacterized Fe-S cluster protein YjdI/CDGSH-type Zn-finger protein
MPRQLKVYRAGELTVTFDPARCIHAAECVRGLPEVFARDERPWIRPERGAPDDVLAVVARCPTGALHAAMSDGRRDVVDEEVSITTSRDGPLYVRGPVELHLEDGTLVSVEGRVALCRCGSTKNAPFCDGSHREIGFRTVIETGA